MSKRYLESLIVKDALASKKMAFVSGPRQVGKTTMAKHLLVNSANYFSWDQSEFRRKWSRSPIDALATIEAGVVVLDEIHKDRLWKRRLKGLYDTAEVQIPIVVTGSARLDLYRKGGDSLLGRYLPYRLHPFSVAERSDSIRPEEILVRNQVNYPWQDLLKYGGFPEPLFAANSGKAERWSRLRLDRLAYEDTRDVKVLTDLDAFRTLLDLIPEKVGSLFSFNSLREDVGVAYATVRDWVLLSENLYYGFFVKPYSKNIKRSLSAEPKFYLYDILQISKATPSKRLENLFALHLLKACHYWTDAAEGLFELHYVRDKEKREVDFLICRDKKPWALFECKSGDKNISPNLLYYSKILKTPLNFQLCEDSNYDKLSVTSNIRVIGYQKMLSGLV